ncbi:MAG TPA: class I SAM-dependent methyltransferase [Symbiobacteriaceae bacterium]|nr:class I SAM-dependent methyltransferase [Symbiobacteriaceae bacterium]
MDAGCGTGRLLIPLLAAGFDVDGADISPDMLALCRAKAEHIGRAPGALSAGAARRPGAGRGAHPRRSVAKK